MLITLIVLIIESTTVFMCLLYVCSLDNRWIVYKYKIISRYLSFTGAHLDVFIQVASVTLAWFQCELPRHKRGVFIAVLM